MKNILLSAIVAISSVATVAILLQSGSANANVELLSAQTVAQENLTTPIFYCGKTLDPSSNKELPTTFLMSSDSSEPIAIALWKSEYFGRNSFTPQKRCETVSPKFQTALVDQGRTKITAGTDKQTGLGIICAVTTEDEVCDRSKMLYTLKSYQKADEIVDRFINVVIKNKYVCIYPPVVRVIDLKHLLQRK